MPRKKSPPSYRLHKARNCAVVTINGKNHYLGPFGSPESHEKYARLIAEWKSGGAIGEPDQPCEEKKISVNEMILAYWRFAETYYVKDGRPSKELSSIREALQPLRQLYGLTAAAEFGPKSLKTLRQHLIKRDLSRGVINSHIGRIKRVFKWAVADELLPPTHYHALQAVAGLEYGRSNARETAPVQPVSDEHVDAVLPFLTPHVAAMIQVQRLTGMRPGEVTSMRPCEIDVAGDVWVYEPADHKNRWRGIHRSIPIGPKAQAVLSTYMDRDPEMYLFSPQESEAWRREHRPPYCQSTRKTPVYPSELRAREKRRKHNRNRKPKRPRRDHYNTASYGRAIKYGIAKAKKAGIIIPHWHPNQLRHARATEVRKSAGLEAAQVALGHARADVTQVYAEKNLELAIKVARESG